MPHYKTIPGGPYDRGATVAAAADNPYSTLAKIRHSRDLDLFNLREAANKANLWYSSERGRQEELLGWEYGRQEHDAATAVQRAIADLDRQLAQATEQAKQSQLQAVGQAASQMQRGGRRQRQSAFDAASQYYGQNISPQMATGHR